MIPVLTYPCCPVYRKPAPIRDVQILWTYRIWKTYVSCLINISKYDPDLRNACKYHQLMTRASISNAILIILQLTQQEHALRPEIKSPCVIIDKIDRNTVYSDNREVVARIRWGNIHGLLLMTLRVSLNLRQSGVLSFREGNKVWSLYVIFFTSYVVFDRTNLPARALAVRVR